ncbi:helix-turn-helix transcriptional regulator [Spongiactinospora sp. TRM90649]|uniref:helix-turn-helix domain-containing protein n=1 Tax=Spongiactinospora sp. TRM90649 TaxID=3031114 RepID=UPI0023F6DBEB|nr:helix-turn-helix transcriptional regulator [Spongiactinospora sp. TRM90649]MDF5753636.1 helix-turn-helix transcriptional regulator [Spongiactinospora sp. TRM90649]
MLGTAMRFHRDAVGLSLRDVAARIHTHASAIDRWETGKTRPSADSAHDYDRAVGAGGELIALHAEAVALEHRQGGTPTADTSIGDEGGDMERRAAMRFLATFTAGAAIPASAVDALHGDLWRFLEANANDYSLSEWEQIAYDYGQTVWTELRPRSTRTTDLVGDIHALNMRLRRAKDSPEQSALLRTYAQLSAFLACELAQTASPRACWRSCHAARTAADASGDRELRVWTRAWEASQSFHLHRRGPAADALVQQALDLADGRPCLGAALALETRTRLLASRRQPEAAKQAITELRQMTDDLPDATTADRISVWGMPMENLDFSRAFVYTALGDSKNAAPLLDAALAATPPEKVGARTNIALMQAWGMIENNDITQGLTRALEVAHPIPVTSYRRVVITELLKGLPANAQAHPAAHELRLVATPIG